MTVARCAECGAGARGASGAPAVIIHKAGCPVGQERAQRSVLNRLEGAARRRDELEEKLAKARGEVSDRAREAIELEVPKTKVAKAAKLNRSRLYKVLS